MVRFGAINTIIEEMLPTFPWLTKNMVKYHLIKLKKQAKEDSATTMLALPITPCCFLVFGTKL
jgi:hypothetical protein